MILVLVVVGLAVVLGSALLQSASLNGQIEHNVTSAMELESRAESGINLGLYYLQHPHDAPSLNGDGYYPGGTALSIGTETIQSLTVNRTAGDVYELVSQVQDGALDRTTRARARVISEYEVKYALAANSDVDLTHGKVRSNAVIGSMLVDGVVSATGTLVTSLLLADGTNGSTFTPAPSYLNRPVPYFSEILFTAALPSYTYNGATYTAQELTSNVNGLLSGNVVTNPANVWYSKSSRKVTFSLTVPGTLVILGESSDLDVDGALSVTPKPGMPGLIVQRDFKLTQNNSAATINGLFWVGRRLESAPLKVINILLNLFQQPYLKVNGALMLATMDSDGLSHFEGELDLSYNASKVDLPDFSSYGRTPAGVVVLDWK